MASSKPLYAALVLIKKKRNKKVWITKSQKERKIRKKYHSHQLTLATQLSTPNPKAVVTQLACVRNIKICLLGQAQSTLTQAEMPSLG